jgi:phosphate/sulfate permease
MGRQLEIIAVGILLAAIFANFMVFSDSAFNVGFTAILSILFLCLSVGLIYWLFFTSSGKDLARKYNAKLTRAAEKKAQEFKEYYRNKSSAFSDLNGFSSSYSMFSTDGKSAISIDENSKKICLLNTSQGQSFNSFDIRTAKRKIVSHSDILEVSIFEDGNSVTTTSRTSQVAGAVIGNLMMGGTGFLIGALTGSKKTSVTISSLEVRLLINDTKSPTWSIAFIRAETPKKSPTYKKYASEAENLLGTIKVLMKRADDEDKLAET